MRGSDCETAKAFSRSSWLKESALWGVGWVVGCAGVGGDIVVVGLVRLMILVRLMMRVVGGGLLDLFFKRLYLVLLTCWKNGE